jgi:hypothetical protein
MKEFDARNNPDLKCIQVSHVGAANNNPGWHKDSSAIYSVDCNNVMTYVPDNNFEQALIDIGYDSGKLNDYVPTKSIDTITYLLVRGVNIVSLTGIQDFISLKGLNCTYNKIQRLDLSVLPKLESFDGRYNPDLSCIQVTDVSQATIDSDWYKDDGAVYSEDCSNLDIPITYIPDNNFEQAMVDMGYDTGPLNDSVPTKNINTITKLDIRGKDISDITGIEDFIALDSLICSQNKLSKLDISNNIALKYLDCSNNKLTSLDFGNSTTLEDLHHSSNRITNLEFSQNVALQYLICSNNNLTALDISKYPDLKYIYVTNNPNLTCIQVKDSSDSENKPNWKKDPSAIYSEDCSTVGVDEGIGVSNDITISPNPASDYIYINVGDRHACSEDLKIYNALGECVMNLTPALSEGDGARIDISGLPPGFYFVRFGDRVSKFIKI